MTNPYPEGTGEHLLHAIFGELPGPDACECGMPTECEEVSQRAIRNERERRKMPQDREWS